MSFLSIIHYIRHTTSRFVNLVTEKSYKVFRDIRKIRHISRIKEGLNPLSRRGSRVSEI